MLDTISKAELRKHIDLHRAAFKNPDTIKRYIEWYLEDLREAHLGADALACLLVDLAADICQGKRTITFMQEQRKANEALS